MRNAALYSMCLLLAACQTAGPLDENSPFQVLPAGSRLVLKQPLTIPARSAGVLIQGGRIVTRTEVNYYHPHCRLEVNDVLETAQSVGADEFTVRRVYQENPMLQRSGYRKVGLRNVTSTIGYYDFRTIMNLYSARQPQVRSLTCSQWGDPGRGLHLSVREIRTALGDLFTLYFPDAATRGQQ